MNKGKRPYSFFHKASAVFMILALMFLTVSAAFTTAPPTVVKKDKIENSQSSDTNNSSEEESNNNNTTEEKVPTANSFSEEYLHSSHQTHYFFTIISTFHKCENADTYVAYHGELLVPPPNNA